MASCLSKDTLRMSIKSNALRCVELLDEIPVGAMNTSYAYGVQKSELKAKRKELRRDTGRMEKLLKTFERA